jgi:hypothetical protein
MKLSWQLKSLIIQAPGVETLIIIFPFSKIENQTDRNRWSSHLPRVALETQIRMTLEAKACTGCYKTFFGTLHDNKLECFDLTNM